MNLFDDQIGDSGTMTPKDIQNIQTALEMEHSGILKMSNEV